MDVERWLKMISMIRNKGSFRTQTDQLLGKLSSKLHQCHNQEAQCTVKECQASLLKARRARHKAMLAAEVFARCLLKNKLLLLLLLLLLCSAMKAKRAHHSQGTDQSTRTK